MILAGGALFVGGTNEVTAYSVTDGSKLWTGKVDGKAYGLAVSGGRQIQKGALGAARGI